MLQTYDRCKIMRGVHLWYCPENEVFVVIFAFKRLNPDTAHNFTRFEMNIWFSSNLPKVTIMRHKMYALKNTAMSSPRAARSSTRTRVVAPYQWLLQIQHRKVLAQRRVVPGVTLTAKDSTVRVETLEFHWKITVVEKYKFYWRLLICGTSLKI